LFLSSFDIFAQNHLNSVDLRVALIWIILLQLLSASVDAQEAVAYTDSSKKQRTLFYRASLYTGAYYATSMVIMSKTWYKDRELVPFHFYNDSKGYQQVDKFGHAFGGYVYSYIGHSYLKSRGFSQLEALTIGGTLGFVLQAPIEIMDGIHEGYGFSWGDMVANASGSALVIGQELLFGEQIVKYKFSYWESEYASRANGYLGKSTFDRVLKDYNGHTYWLSVPIAKIFPNRRIPPWLCISFGYGANGMYGEFYNISEYNGVSIPYARRYRQYIVSLDIDWTKIPTQSKFLKVVFKGLTFVKFPFSAIELTSSGQVKGHWIYY